MDVKEKPWVKYFKHSFSDYEGYIAMSQDVECLIRAFDKKSMRIKQEYQVEHVTYHVIKFIDILAYFLYIQTIKAKNIHTIHCTKTLLS